MLGNDEDKIARSVENLKQNLGVVERFLKEGMAQMVPERSAEVNWLKCDWKELAVHKYYIKCFIFLT